MLTQISADKARAILENESKLIEFEVIGKIEIMGETWSREVTIENCIIESFDGSVTSFEKPLKFINCHFNDCKFIFSFFLKGLTIENCTFDKYLDFQAGGHNKNGFPVVISGNMFNDFVNFFDCWYESEVVIKDNHFVKGTNIESKLQYLTFDIPPLISDNKGRIDIESEYSL